MQSRGGNVKKLVLITICLVFIFSMVYTTDFNYIGTKKCRICHKGPKKGNVYETWKSKKHAIAFESIKAKGQEKNEKCLACHTTAFNKGGYKMGDPNAAKFEGVGCESCHGPGSVYKKTKIMKDRELALKNGMINITEKTCTGCHDGSEHAGGKFNYKEALKKISHVYRKK
jgi:hypothetical protein